MALTISGDRMTQLCAYLYSCMNNHVAYIFILLHENQRVWFCDEVLSIHVLYSIGAAVESLQTNRLS